MVVVLLKNRSRTLLALNTGDRSVTVERSEVARNKHGSVGTRTTEHAVSGSVTLLPGQTIRVPGCILKQPNVQRLIDLRVLQVVKQEQGDATLAPSRVSVGKPVRQKTAATVTEEGTAPTKVKRRRKKEQSK